MCIINLSFDESISSSEYVLYIPFNLSDILRLFNKTLELFILSNKYILLGWIDSLFFDFG